MNGHVEDSKSADSSQSKLTIKFADNFVVDGHTEYRILVRDTKKNESWTITSRYSDLRKVHLKLRELFPNNLPNFPQKKLIGNMETSFISQRQKALDIYFSFILNNQTWSNSRPVKDLLATKTHTKSLVSSSPKEESKGAKSPDINSTSSTPIKNEAPRIEKQSPYHIALEKNLEQITNKFFDLQLNLLPPDEDEAKRRGQLYQKINEIGAVKLSNEYFKLPAGKAGLVTDARSDPTSQYTKLQKLLSETLHNVKQSMHAQAYLGKVEIINQFK